MQHPTYGKLVAFSSREYKRIRAGLFEVSLMHIVLLVLGVVAGLGFWWYRLRAAHDAAGEVVDAVGRMRGSMRRKKIRNQNQLSPLTAVNDPIVAAATILVAVATDDVALSTAREETIRAEIGKLTSPDKLEEAVIYGKWAAAQIADTAVVIDKLGPFLAERLDGAEKHGMMTMARNVCAAEGPDLPLEAQRFRRLTQKLGLEVH